jgi:hypothetical protein
MINEQSYHGIWKKYVETRHLTVVIFGFILLYNISVETYVLRKIIEDTTFEVA